MQLRDYQQSAIDRLRESIQKGHRRVILHAPTGAGKTVMATNIIFLAREKGSKVLFLANRRELIFQAKATISKFGVESSIVMAGQETDHANPVKIASMQTYVRRMNLEHKDYNPWFHQAKVIIVDECHGSLSQSYQKILQSYGSNAVVIGLTATPCRGDGRGLGEYFDDIVASADIGDLIDQGHLVPIRYFVPSTPDLAGVKTVMGDYDKVQLGTVMDQKKLVGDIVGNWLKICSDRPTIVFAVNVRHSIRIAESFMRVGITAEHLDAKTGDEERAAILDRLKHGKTQIVCNFGILTEGFDFPAAGCIILARPTKNLGLYLQMAGRGIRTYPGKENCVLIDHGGCVEHHGLVEWAREWSLDGKEITWKERKKKEKEKKASICRACNLVYEGAAKCPDCGTEAKRFGKEVEVVEEDLVELNKAKTATIADKRIFLGMLKHYVAEHKKSHKMINGAYKGRYGCWPHHSVKDVAPIEPDVAFLAYMRHQMIKFAKRKAQ